MTLLREVILIACVVGVEVCLALAWLVYEDKWWDFRHKHKRTYQFNGPGRPQP